MPILRRVGHVQQGTHLLDAFTLTVEVEYSNRQYRPMQDVYDPFLLVRLETTVIAVSGVDAVYTFLLIPDAAPRAQRVFVFLPVAASLPFDIFFFPFVKL